MASNFYEEQVSKNSSNTLRETRLTQTNINKCSVVQNRRRKSRLPPVKNRLNIERGTAVTELPTGVYGIMPVENTFDKLRFVKVNDFQEDIIESAFKKIKLTDDADQLKSAPDLNSASTSVSPTSSSSVSPLSSTSVSPSSSTSVSPSSSPSPSSLVSPSSSTSSSPSSSTSSSVSPSSSSSAVTKCSKRKRQPQLVDEPDAEPSSCRLEERRRSKRARKINRKYL